MSADNVIWVEQIGDRWAIWEDSMSNLEPAPGGHSTRYFVTRDHAYAAAIEMQDEWQTEYGVRLHHADS